MSPDDELAQRLRQLETERLRPVPPAGHVFGAEPRTPEQQAEARRVLVRESRLFDELNPGWTRHTHLRSVS